MAASDAPESVKVFVGNLSFKITQDQLKDAFKSIGGVVSANIITRGPRSLGYGFVEFSSRSDAEKAVASLNQTELDNRPINVEIAKPRVPRTEVPAAQAGESVPKPTPAAGTRRRTTRRARPRRPRAATGATTGAAAATGETAATPVAATSAASSSTTRAPRTRAPRNTENKEASKTTLFIANLPFRVDEAGLAQLFIDHGCPPKSTRVVQRRERSKGFGFAEFEDEQKQQAALTALDKESVDGRVLIVKVAFAVADSVPAPADSVEASASS